MNSEIVSQFVGALIRNLLAAAFGWMVVHGWLTTEQAQSFDLTQISIGIAGMLVVLLWSFYQKVRERKALKSAIHASALTENAVRDKAAEKPFRYGLK